MIVSPATPVGNPSVNVIFHAQLFTAEDCRANSEGWKLDLSGFVADDMPWIMRYDAAEAGHDDWHIDIGRGANASRKLGFSLQPSPADSYDAGDLEFVSIDVDKAALRHQGALIIFAA